jgi:hypothetical protein
MFRMSRLFRSNLMRIPLALAPLTAAPSAWAALGDTCATDADCGAGLVCETVGGTACACAAGESCDCPEATELKACMPGPCESDTDCGDGLICVSYEVPCATPAIACTPDSECPEPPPCTPTTASVCAPRWVLPCEQASDCGEGFTCDPIEVCTCSGGASEPATPVPAPPDSGSGDSGSSGSGDSGSSGSSDSEAPPPPEDCTCAPGEEFACRPVEVACEDDAACPSGWSCIKADAVSTPPCAPDQPCDPLPPQEPMTSGTCAPAGWALASDTGTGGTDRGLEVANGSAEVAPTASPTSDVQTSGGGCAGGAASATFLFALGGLILRRRSV